MIKLENITKEYITDAGPVKALNGIDLSIPDGEIIAITGQSGSGKSSLMNVIGCLDSPTLIFNYHDCGVRFLDLFFKVIIYYHA